MGADNWETVALKYFENPDIDLCPGSGIYACFENDRICGVQAAYPFPVVKDGVSIPATCWSIGVRLDKTREKGPAFRAVVAGKLFMTLKDLPGRKYASYGSEASQRAYRGRAKRIPVNVAAAILSPMKAALLELLGLRAFVTASEVPAQIKVNGATVEVLRGMDLMEFHPTPPEGAVHAYHSPEFWKTLGVYSHSTGAVLLRIHHKGISADFMLRVQAAGKLRVALLLSTAFEKRDNSSIAAIGQSIEEGPKANRCMRAICNRVRSGNRCSLESDHPVHNAERESVVVRGPTHGYVFCR